MYSFRSPNPRRLASFWAELMELPVSDTGSGDLVMLDFDHQVGPVTWMWPGVPCDSIRLAVFTASPQRS